MKRIQIADHCICCDSTRLASAPAILMPFVAKRALGIDPVEITAEWGLRDLKQGTSYLPCHSLQCQTCGALFLDIRFTDAQMASLYHGYRDAAYNAQRDFFEPGYAATVANDYRYRHAYLDTLETWLAPHLPACLTVLDWGGGDGTNTPFLGKGTIHIHDISEVAPVAGATAAPPRFIGYPIRFDRLRAGAGTCSSTLGTPAGHPSARVTGHAAVCGSPP